MASHCAGVGVASGDVSLYSIPVWCCGRNAACQIWKSRVKRRLLARNGLALLHGARRVRSQHAAGVGFGARLQSGCDARHRLRLQKPGGAVNIARLPARPMPFCPKGCSLSNVQFFGQSARTALSQPPEPLELPLEAAFSGFCQLSAAHQTRWAKSPALREVRKKRGRSARLRYFLPARFFDISRIARMKSA